MPASAMKHLVTTSLCCNSSHDCRSHDCRAFTKAALIRRREIASYRNDNNHTFTVKEYGFKEQCQETSVPDGLKFLAGMITRGSSAEETVTETQATLSIAQLVFFNTTTKAINANRTQTPPPVYIGAYIHSRFRSGDMVDELATLGLSVNYRRAMYLEKNMGLSVIQQFTDEGYFLRMDFVGDYSPLEMPIIQITIRLQQPLTNISHGTGRPYIVVSITFYHG